MKGIKNKILIFLLLSLVVFFFSNDFGLVSIENTAIITAVAIDYDNDEYKITAQIAVPEATDTNTENLKAQLTARGSTVASAIKKIGDNSGWFPQLTFCNLIILGNGMTRFNVITVLDYFAKTLRVQDSAVVVLAEKEASELIKATTPLDNVSSFALQKILLKNPGFDMDTATVDIKSFCAGYYSESHSGYMPIVKMQKADEPDKGDGGAQKSSQNSGGIDSAESESGGASEESDSRSNKNDFIFNAKTTALFYDGKKVGELNEGETLAFCALTTAFAGTTVELDDVYVQNKGVNNYLLTVLQLTPSIKMRATDSEVSLTVNVDAYCKISDQNSDHSEATLTKNIPLPPEVQEKATEKFTQLINDMLEKQKSTGCDFLRLNEMLYRYHHKYYKTYKNDLLGKIKTTVNVNVSGQK